MDTFLRLTINLNEWTIKNPCVLAALRKVASEDSLVLLFRWPRVPSMHARIRVDDLSFETFEVWEIDDHPNAPVAYVDVQISASHPRTQGTIVSCARWSIHSKEQTTMRSIEHLVSDALVG